ncbi:hypothetical protein FRB99_007808 [Tulasnella sp. 403]|nr:hypothetical protein FRB99_007808 [Tulasnella sp. 403]
MVSTRSGGAIDSTNVKTVVNAPASPPNKRQRKAKIVVPEVEERGDPNSLHSFSNVPVEVFSEICQYLALLDIRNLAVTTRRFYQVLMSKDAKRIWQTACQNTPGIPECPPDMTEPQFAYFLYEIDCTKCNNRGTRIDFFYRTRLCGRCYNKWFEGSRETKAAVEGARPVIEATTTEHRLVFGFGRLPKRRIYRPFVEACYAEWCELPDGDDEASRVARDGFVEKWTGRKAMKYKTGLEMQNWVMKSIDSPWTGEVNRRRVRVGEVRARLLEAGWNVRDIPPVDPAFLALAGKGPPLTPEGKATVWQKLLPKLEPIVKARHEQRLKDTLKRQERFRWRQRSSRLRVLYGRLTYQAAPTDLHRKAISPTVEDFLDLPGAKRILGLTAQQVPQEMWVEVEEEARQFVLTTQEEALAQVLTVLKIDREPPPEGNEARYAKIRETIVLLSRPTSGFWCQTCQRASWFPITSCYHPGHAIVPLVDSPSSPPGKPFLVTALLASAGLDGATFDASAENHKPPRFICSRCDERVAECKSFGDLLRHYHSAQVWYERTTTLINSNPKKAYRKRRNESFEPPEIANRHDWSTDEPLARELTPEQLHELKKQQLAFEEESKKDPNDDELGEGGEAFSKDYTNRRLFRTCKLCPVGYSPEHTTSARIKIHIQSHHNKEPDLEADTNLHSKRWPCLIEPAVM